MHRAPSRVTVLAYFVRQNKVCPLLGSARRRHGATSVAHQGARCKFGIEVIAESYPRLMVAQPSGAVEVIHGRAQSEKSRWAKALVFATVANSFKVRPKGKEEQALERLLFRTPHVQESLRGTVIQKPSWPSEENATGM